MFYKFLYLAKRLNHGIGRRLYPIIYTKIAKLKLLSVCATFGKGLKVDGKIILSNNERSISLGNNVIFLSRYKSNLVGMSFPITLQTMEEGKIEIGNGSGFSSVIIYSKEYVKIGNNVMVGGDVRIYDNDFHSLNYEHRRDGKTDRDNVKSAMVIIEDDVFIGATSIILKGVKIGARSIIGAGSVVSLKEIPPDSLVAGNPARIIKSLV